MIEAADIQTNYEEAFNFLQKRKQRQVRQLVLLNNLQRGDKNIASTLLVTLFNRVLSNLYDDKKQVKFLPSQGIDQEKLNAYNILAESDYMEMNKAKLDYDWTWDTLFFGRGYMETLKFDERRKIMEPHVINPLVFGYDPYFEDVKDWRYYWKWVTKNKWQIQKLIKQGIITGITKPEEIMGGVDEYLWDYKTRRDQAKLGQEPSKEPADADVYQILEYFGYDDDGDKAVFWVDKGFSKILYQEKLDLQDGDDGTSEWPIVVKESYREPHSSITFSIADLIEDKHRAKSVLLNLAFIAAKDTANPLYWYDEDKIKDKAQFFSRQVNQHIPVEGNGADAVGPLNTQDPMSPGLINFMSLLQGEANDPVGTAVESTPETSKGQQTATEISIDQQLNDIAQSLQSKVMGFGEQEFWSHWFHRYAKNADSLGTKMANIVGVKGVDSTEVDLADFNTDFPPGVMIYSAKEAEFKNLVKRRDFMTLYPNLLQSMDADGIRNFNKHVFFPLFLEDPSLTEVMFPKTIDEIQAEEENVQLAKDEVVEAKETDNHQSHIYIHMQVQPKTWATWIHINRHKMMLAEQKQKELDAQEQQQMQAGQPPPQAGPPQPGKQNQVGKEEGSPLQATAPLKQETETQTNINNQ